MQHRSRVSRRVWSAFLCVSLVSALTGALPATAAAPKGVERPSGAQARTAPTVPEAASRSGDVIAARLDGTLAEKLASAKTPAAKAARVDVAVLTAKGAKAPRSLKMPLRLRLRGDAKHDLIVGKVALADLVKLATSHGVEKVYDNGRRTPPPIPDKVAPSRVERSKAASIVRDRLRAAKTAGALGAFRDGFDADGRAIRSAGRPALSSRDAALQGTSTGARGGGATGWFDVGPSGHNAVGAWDDGYFGEGVRVAVADDSVDFAHPDLQGTQAVVTDPASPYVGWPEAFDPFSALLYAYDRYYGTSYVADGQTWWSDTSATITEADPTFDGKTYVLPGTSKSGVYHIGYLWDENLYVWMSGETEFPAVLVSDETTPGVYDTVYVDLGYFQDFSFQKPCTMASPISYLDYWDSESEDFGPDGYADLSGGTVYWIADGEHQPPGFEFMFGHDPDLSAPGAGELVCFMGALNFDENHGTLCASNVVGQGVTDGPSDPIMDDGVYPPFKTPTGGGDGIVQGAAKAAELVAFADIYWNHFTSTLMAYDYAAFGADGEAGTGDEIHIVSNSYGESDEDADEWDYRSRYITALNTLINPNVSFLFSTGNGAPGYGTNAPPTPATGIGIGASTQMGACGGWDSIIDADQVTIGDVIPWSNRGPSAAGHTGPAVVADGAYSSGAMALNQGAWDGWRSWVVWGGTSRSCPVAAGNLALIYEAYHDTHGRYPTYAEARSLLMSGARDLNHDTTVQGAGIVDAGRSVDIVLGQAGFQVTPSEWYPGTRYGSYPSFANIVHPGDVALGTLRLTNAGDDDRVVTVSDAWLVLSRVVTMTVTLDGDEEPPYDFNRPDRLEDLTMFVADADPDLLVIKATESFSDFAPTGAFDTNASTHNRVRLLAYDWKDQDADERLWTDVDTDGYVDPGEIDAGEYMRFTYANNFANSHEIRVQKPIERMHDGIYLGIQHQYDATADKTVAVELRIECYDKVDHPWLTADTNSIEVPAAGAADLDVWLSVPDDAAVGFYEGEFVLTDDSGFATIVPVHVTVASPTPNFSFGDPSVIGSSEPDSAVLLPLMDNGRIMGYQDWQWRAESGDWRFYVADVAADAELPAGATWLVRTTWPEVGDGSGMQADVDTLLYGQTPDAFSTNWPGIFGPGALAKTGGSANNNIGAGIWTWQTNTGGTEEWVAGPLSRGLNEIMLHNVVWPGTVHDLPITGEAGVVGVDPGRIDIVDAHPSGTACLDFTTTMDLNGLDAMAFGLTKPFTSVEQIGQGEDWYKDVALSNAAYLDVEIHARGNADLDLYVYRWNGSSWVLVGASETSTGDEYVRLDRPADGDYLVDVYGYSVSGTETFDVSIAAPAGDDLSVSGMPSGGVSAGSTVHLTVSWAKDRTASLEDREGTYEGVVYVGPVEAPSAVPVPVTLRYPFEIESCTPEPGSSVDDPYAQVHLRFSKRLDASSVDTSSIVLTDGTESVPATLTCDDESGEVTLTPTQPLRSGTEYGVVVDGVTSRDGDVLSETITFSTIESLGRFGGQDRYETAVQACQDAFEGAESVVLATGEAFPDALAASGLAGVLKAPVLITRSTSLVPAVRDEIMRLGATKVYLIGGTGALSAAVASQVDAIPGVSIERIGGRDRYETAAAVAAKVVALDGLGYDGQVFLVRGDDFADAVSVSAYAYAQRMPVLLTKPQALPAATRNALVALHVADAWVAGGTGAVSAQVVSQVEDAVPGLDTHRMSGADRYATAVAIAEMLTSHGWASWTNVGITTGTGFADSLCGGVATGRRGGVMLMTARTALSPATRGALEANAGVIRRVTVYGGTSAVPLEISNAIADLLW